MPVFAKQTLEKARQQREQLESKMQAINSKVIVGGVNLVCWRRGSERGGVDLPQSSPFNQPVCAISSHYIQLEKAEEQERLLEAAQAELEERQRAEDALMVCGWVEVGGAE